MFYIILYHFSYDSMKYVKKDIISKIFSVNIYHVLSKSLYKIFNFMFALELTFEIQ